MSTKYEGPDDSAASGGGGAGAAGQWTLCKVIVIYRNPGGQVREKEVDLDSAGGIWWRNDGGAYPGGQPVPGIPKPGNDDDCPPAPPGPGDKCWWDPQTNQWVCPGGWE